MNIANLFKIAFRALNNNKLRCFLTMLGIIIGVASVITMLAIGQGSKRSIKKQISEMGSNMIMIHPGNMERGGVRQSSDDMQTLKLDDYTAICDETEYVAAVSPSVQSSGQFINGANNYPSSLYGISQGYLDIRKISIDEGEMFTDRDIQAAAKVCLIGKTVADNLFPDGESPVGKIIRFNKIPFTVIGTLVPKGYNSMGMDQDDLVLAPYTTVQKRVLAITYLQGIFCSALSEELTEQAIDEISVLLRRNHKLTAHEEDDFEIRHIASGRRHRYHEYHVCFRDRTHQRDRPAHVDRSPRHRYIVAISSRSHPYQCHRRHHRGAGRCRSLGRRARIFQVAYLH